MVCRGPFWSGSRRTGGDLQGSSRFAKGQGDATAANSACAWNNSNVVGENFHPQPFCLWLSVGPMLSYAIPHQVIVNPSAARCTMR
jgi:hypothetical protein